ncbi:hypothetical protein [Marinomonas sp. 5E14-1]
MLQFIKAKTARLKSWQWFLLLYLGGTLTLISISYGIKLFIAGIQI